MEFGIIGFDRCKISCIIGALESERKEEQTLFFDVRIKYDFSLPAYQDKVEDAICYEKLKSFCTNFAREAKCHLLETLLVRLMDALFKEYRVQWAFIRIKKPSAIFSADCAVAELERER